MTFEEQVTNDAQDATLKFLKTSDWLTVEHADWFKIAQADLRLVYEIINTATVPASLKKKLEQWAADMIFNALVDKVATDVERIMANTELHEDCRAAIRAKIRDVAEGLE